MLYFFKSEAVEYACNYKAYVCYKKKIPNVPGESDSTRNI